MIELSTKVQIVLHTSKVLQENWDKTMALILKVHSNFLSHFGINVKKGETIGEEKIGRLEKIEH